MNVPGEAFEVHPHEVSRRPVRAHIGEGKRISLPPGKPLSRRSSWRSVHEEDVLVVMRARRGTPPPKIMTKSKEGGQEQQLGGERQGLPV